jgi:hypothetical protein
MSKISARQRVDTLKGWMMQIQRDRRAKGKAPVRKTKKRN